MPVNFGIELCLLNPKTGQFEEDGDLTVLFEGKVIDSYPDFHRIPENFTSVIEMMIERAFIRGQKYHAKRIRGLLNIGIENEQ